MGKKDKFDPLGGSLSGSGMPKQKKSKKNKSPDLLTGGRNNVESDIYPEDYSMDRYAGYSGGTDALMPGSESAQGTKKKGIFGSIFGSGKKKQKKEEPQRIPETSAPVRRETVSEPVVTAETVFEEDLFEEETAVFQIEEEIGELPKGSSVLEHIRESVSEIAEASQETKFSEEDKETIPPKPFTSHDPKTCAICGTKSETDLPYFTLHPGVFEAGNSIPLCKTCFRAVTTLMKFRESDDEEEICEEWSKLCLELDQDYATYVVTEGRKYH